MSNIDLSLLPDFIVEAEEHLEEMEALLLKLVQRPDDLDVLNDIFRPIHTIKGGAQYIGLDKISHLSHRLEDLLDLLRDGSMSSNSEIVETLITATDRIALLVKELEATQTEDSDVEDLVALLNTFIDGDAGAPASVESSPVEETLDESSASSYEAEEDQELYGIFEAHLQEHYGELAALIQQLSAGGDTTALLEQSLSVLEQMRSSANYMDYVDLVHRYQIWKSDIETVLQEVQGGGAPQLNTLSRNMSDLAEQFPVLKLVTVSPSVDVGEQVSAAEDSGDVSDAVARAFAEESEADVSDAVARAFAETSASDVAPSASAPVEASPGNIDLSLLPDFVIEAEEHLVEMEALLLQLMQQADDRDVLNEIFRTVHSIKGSAQYIGLTRVSHLSHVMEDLLDLLREGAIESNFDIVETLITARDRFSLLNEELKHHQQEQSGVDDLVAAMSQWLPTSEQVSAESAATSPAASIPASQGSSAPYHDEEDEELFEIFIAHLQEQHDEIVSLLGGLAGGADKVESLAACEAVLEKMSASANYMDYVELVQRYKIWQNEMLKAREDLLAGTETSIAFMQHNLDELAALFPQLRSDQPVMGSSDDATIKVVVNEPVVGGLQDTLAKKETDERAAAVQGDAVFNEQLFNSLAGALDRSMPKVSGDEYDTLNKIFDELVSGEPEAGVKPALAASKTAPKEKMPTPVSEVKKKESAETKIKKSVRVDADKIDILMNQVGELVVDRSYFFQLMSEMRNLQRHLKETMGLEQKEVKLLRTFTYRLGEAIASLGRTSNDLQEGVMKMRMLPISQIFNRYPRLVHDLTRNSDKKVNLVVKGEDTELDRMIVEELSDPLIHIIRNAVDHGIETGPERQQKGKEDEGTLVLEAYQESNHIVIEVTDDGKGIDPEKVRQKAMDKGLYSEEELERFSNDDLIALILTAGFSTADKITGTSGRGVGMDVVKKNIEKLNGTLEIDSRVGVGTQMRLKIPLTLAIIHALMVRVSDDLFTIPLANVDETVRIFKSETSTVEGVEVIHLRGETLPIFRLSTLFGEEREDESDKSFVVIVSVGGQRTGFVVDELLGQEEVVIKPLADYVQDKSGFSGATIIGDGRISLILDTYEMVRMTANKQAKKQQVQTEYLKSKIRRTGMPADTAVIEDSEE
ncbi:MAG: Hpt domain-containing protein [Pseudomonadota bacterium]